MVTKQIQTGDIRFDRLATKMLIGIQYFSQVIWPIQVPFRLVFWSRVFDDRYAITIASIDPYDPKADEKYAEAKRACVNHLREAIRSRCPRCKR